MDCCCGYERVFGARAARHDARRYRKQGPKQTQALLIGFLREGRMNVYTGEERLA